MQAKILSYAVEKMNHLSWEYGKAKVEEVNEKMKPLWKNLVVRLNEHIADEDLPGAKKNLDEYFELTRREIIRTFN